MNEPLYISNPSNASSKGRTVLVLGLARGGTSLIAGVLRELGVFMGDYTHPLKHEFDLFRESDDSATILRLAAALDAQHKVWGWKSPRTVFFADKILHHLRNPHIIVALRNPIAAAQSAGKYNQLPFRVSFMETVEVIYKISEFTSRCPYPLAFLNFELALKDPHGVVDGVKAFLNLPDPDGERTRNAVEFIHDGGGYHPIQVDAARRQSLLDELEVDNKIDTLGILNQVIPDRIAELNGMADHLERDISAAEAVVDHLMTQVPATITSGSLNAASKGAMLRVLDPDGQGATIRLDEKGDSIFQRSIAERESHVAARWHEVSELQDAYQAAWNRLQAASLRRAELQNWIELLACLK